jgi:hypothetical protein
MADLVTQAEFARRRGVSRKTVTKWKQAGKLVMQGELVDVEASEARLAHTARADAAPTPKAQEPAAAPATPMPPEVDAEQGGAVDIRDDETAEQAAERLAPDRRRFRSSPTRWRAKSTSSPCCGSSSTSRRPAS